MSESVWVQFTHPDFATRFQVEAFGVDVEQWETMIPFLDLARPWPTVVETPLLWVDTMVGTVAAETGDVLLWFFTLGWEHNRISVRAVPSEVMLLKSPMARVLLGNPICDKLFPYTVLDGNVDAVDVGAGKTPLPSPPLPNQDCSRERPWRR